MKPTEYKVAVIDDGINEEYYGVKSLSFNVEITPDQLLTQRCCYKKKYSKPWNYMRRYYSEIRA